MNILEEVQIYVADRLNADSQLSGLCPFIFENKRDIDYEIKSALGKQGVVGLVMTPKATYAGAYMDVGISWQLDELEIDIIENVTVNRGKKNGYVTGQDAAMRLFEVMCPLSGGNEGQFSPVSYEEGEDNNLLVNKCVLKCLVHNTIIPEKTIVQFVDGSSRTYDIQGQMEMNWLGSGVYSGDVVGVEIGEEVTGLGEKSFTGFGQLSSIVVPNNVTNIGNEAFSWTGLTNVVIEDGVTELGYGAFSYSNSLSSITLPSTLTKIGADVFEECGSLSSVSIPKSVVNISQVAFRYSRLSGLTMAGRTKAEVLATENYSWGLDNGCVIHCTDGDVVVGTETVVQYKSGLTRYLDIEGELTYHSIPSVIYTKEVSVGNEVSSIGGGAFEQCQSLTNVTIPGNVKTIGEAAFLGCIALSSVVMSAGVETIGGGAFTNCRSLSNVVMPSSVTSIGDEAFFSCASLKNINSNDGVYLPDGIQTIGQYAFKDSGIEKLSFDNRIAQGIDSDAFAECNQLSDVVVRGVTTHEAMSLENYPWGISDENIIRGDRGI